MLKKLNLKIHKIVISLILGFMLAIYNAKKLMKELKREMEIFTQQKFNLRNVKETM